MSRPRLGRALASACLRRAVMAAAGLAAVAAGAPAVETGQAPPAPTPMERITLPPAPLRETPSLLVSSPAGWTSVQPEGDLAGWVRGPWPATATLGPQQWSVDPSTGHLVCDGRGEHEWLRYDREMGDAAFHVEWRFAPVEGADKYNSGVFVRTALDLSVWHQAQVGLEGGFLFGPTPIDGVVKRVTQKPAALRVRPAGEWNTYEVLARGGTISLWVNGAFTSEIAVAVPRGFFGLEAEGWRIEFRNLKTKSLD